MSDCRSGAQPVPHCDAARWLRAARRARRLNQRELAELAGVPTSTIAAIEAGSRSPGLALFARILEAAGHRLTVLDVEAQTSLVADDAHDAVRDRAGRRFPAHLAWYRRREPEMPDHTFRQRPREERGPLREHPWFGQFRARGGCYGPKSEPCANCVNTCDYED